MAENQILITSTNRGPATTQAHVRGMKIDFFHNSENHISPVEYTLAALAGCLNGVGYRVAKDMGFELKGMDININASIDTSRLIGEDTDKRAGLAEVRVSIHAIAQEREEILKKWLENVEYRCPMSDIISNPTYMSIVLV